MPIDSLAITYSGARGMRTVIPGSVAAVAQRVVIEAFADLLPSVGWTLVQSIKATAQVDYPLGYPAVADTNVATPKLTVGCRPFPWLTVGGTTFTLYDPYKEQPISGAHCIFVAKDTTAFGGLSNLADAVTDNTPFDGAAVSDSGGLHLIITAKLGGSAYNGVGVIGDGSFGVATGFTEGGGYEFESDDQGGDASVYSVSITARESIMRLYFDFALQVTSPVQTVQYILHSVPQISPDIEQYNIAANGSSFAIWDQTDDFFFPPDLRQTSLFAAAPYKPASEGFDPLAYAVFIAGPHTLRRGTSWGGPIGFSATTCLDDVPHTYGSATGGFPRCLVLRSPGPALLTPSGKPVTIGAYVAFSKNPASTTEPIRVVGKLLDCAIVQDVIDVGLSIGGHRLIKLGSQDGSNGYTRSSLVMAID